MDEFTVGGYRVYGSKVIGKGSTGVICQGIRLADSLPVAVKIITLQNQDEPARLLLANQKEALRTIQHPNLVKLYDIVDTQEACFIITQLLPQGTLLDYLHRHCALPQQQALPLFRKILEATSSYICKCILHRDLKPANIMMRSETEPVIIDFGFSEIIRPGKPMRVFNVGSPLYLSPEACLKTMSSEKSESWALGIILFEMLHGTPPTAGFPNIKDFYETLRVNPTEIIARINPNLSETTREILQKSLLYDQNDRMSVNRMKYLLDLQAIQQKQFARDVSQLTFQPHQPHQPYIPQPRVMNTQREIGKENRRENCRQNQKENLRRNEKDNYVSGNSGIIYVPQSSPLKFRKPPNRSSEMRFIPPKLRMPQMMSPRQVMVVRSIWNPMEAQDGLRLSRGGPIYTWNR